MTPINPPGYRVTVLAVEQPGVVRGRMYLHAPASVLRWTREERHSILFANRKSADQMLGVVEKLGMVLPGVHADCAVLSAHPMSS